jgi:O-antigen/teichoic acid export membrane protein
MTLKIKKILSSKGLQQSIVMVCGSITATGISAISLILISRMLGPNNFGEFSFGFSLILILVRINDLGLSSALMKFVGQTKENKKKNIYFSISTKIKLIASLILMFFGILFFNYLNLLFNLKHPLIILAAFTFGISSVYLEHLNSMLQAVYRFNQTVFANLLQSIVKLFSAFIFYFIEAKSVVLIFTFYALAPITPLFFYKNLLPKYIHFLKNPKYINEKKELLDMAKHTGIANISTTLVSQISIIFVQAFLTSYETGILGGVSKIQMLFTLIAVSLGNVLFPRVSRYKKYEDRLKYLGKAFGIVIVSIIFLIISLVLSEKMILITIGKEYLSGINVLYILLVAVFIMIATVPFTALFYSFEKNSFFSISGFIQVTLIVVGNIILIPKYGLIGTAYTQLLTAIVMFVITLTWSIYLYFYQKKTQINHSQYV